LQAAVAAVVTNRHRRRDNAADDGDGDNASPAGATPGRPRAMLGKGKGGVASFSQRKQGQQSLDVHLENMDTNKDGLVDEDELQAGFGSASTAKGILGKYDEDGDGKLSKAELRKMRGVLCQQEDKGLRLLEPRSAVENVKAHIEEVMEVRL
jgi:hypothetical protein